MDNEKYFNIILEVGRELSQKNNLDDILIILGDKAKEILNVDRCSIFLYDEDSHELWTRLAQGIDGEIRIPANKGVVGSAFISEDVQVVIDAYDDFRFNPEIDKKTNYRTENILAVPLTNTSLKVFGVFQAINKKNGIFTSLDVDILILLSTIASSAIDNAILLSQLKDSQYRVIQRLANASEFKDEEKSKHSIKIGLYSQLLAKSLNLNEKEIEHIKLTAPLHDVGKIGITDRILLKPRKLTYDEFEIMKKHCEFGYSILHDDKDEMLKMAASIAKEHHERYDGTGYPQGLIGEDISIYARIVSVADVFDVLTSNKIYKIAWSFDESVKYIKDERAKHFDPHVVDVFLDNLDQFREIYLQYKE